MELHTQFLYKHIQINDTNICDSSRSTYFCRNKRVSVKFKQQEILPDGNIKIYLVNVKKMS